MAEFKEELVINALHPEKVKLGKKYWYADNIADLKNYVEGDFGKPSVLARISKGLFVLSHSAVGFYLLYPYEEPPKKRMTARQLSEWLTRGFGQFIREYSALVCDSLSYYTGYDDAEVDEDYKIRYWNSDEWQEPTVDIYERDCKGSKE